ncbi:winged helix DNA-binding domain-containing protein [Fomitiporia mediterranea MF3/22]|uniref:winged helix DNA-binding domain-containing protein n=1 Tax=Fomitiporia mediterranea (strain MF3/22) TaxID=694068 RepID=UPI00044085A7|nr:winged helix DNA-binding domain-containing protein [Fomitiporia mediterranea MF3/22]EJC98944.1 winged helix DNA-binding domain-containing protein [Fomitiporia mediterranea MF3/22]
MNRLGGVGLAALERHRESERSFATLSDTISRAQVDSLRSQLAQFRSALQHFASTHRDKIKRDPAFRHAFSQMCANIGVDPLTDSGGSGGRKGGGGWWSEILGLSDWNLELGVQIVDICVSTRERNGGLIEMAELVRLLGKLRGSARITEEDVVRSIKTLKPLGAGYEVLDIGGTRMVRSVTKELDIDQGVVLSVARETGGRITERILADKTGWTVNRAHAALENMTVRDGLCWLDEQDEQIGRAYWIVSVMQWDE